MKEFLRRHSLVIGILLMFLLTWPIDLSNAGVLKFKVPFAVYLLLGWGFIIAALVMTGPTLGRTGVVKLLKRYLIWKVDWKWYAAAFLLLPALNYLAIALHAAWTRVPIDFSNVLAHQFLPPAPLWLLALPYLLFDAIVNGEEMGWRGYVLPRLQVKYSALTASLILGVLWAAWHIPKFVTNWDTAIFLWFVVDTIAKAILMTWMYNGTRGSLLLVTLFHASMNTAGMMLPMPNTLVNTGLQLRGLIGVVDLLAAVMVVVFAGAERLSRTEPRQVEEEGGPQRGQAAAAPESLPPARAL